MFERLQEAGNRPEEDKGSGPLSGTTQRGELAVGGEYSLDKSPASGYFQTRIFFELPAPAETVNDPLFPTGHRKRPMTRTIDEPT